jgi:hypothetical protein
MSEQAKTENVKANGSDNHFMMVVGGAVLLLVIVGFIASLDYGFNSIMSASLAVPLYFIGEGSFNLAIRRWPTLSAENGGFSILRVFKGAVIGTLLFFAVMAVYFAF